MSVAAIIFPCLGLTAQTLTITGKVTDHKGEVLTGVNVYIENTYDGATSGADGVFSFETHEKGNQTIAASFIGFQPWEKEVKLGGNLEIDIQLRESTQTLDAVTITAGSFEASDEKRASALKPFDIYTTAGALGDINGALKTLPGTQPAADDGRLLVRGGEAYETKTLIDGLLVAKPYYSKVPDLPTRGRFAPSLFAGTFFNTGGYSAEYGQALSSVLVLNSQDMATEDLTSVSLMTIGPELGVTKTWKRSSLMMSAGYTNLSPYYSMTKNNMDWIKAPENVSGTIVFRQKVNGSGLFKAFVTSDTGVQKFNTESGVLGQKLKIDRSATATYVNLHYSDELSKKTIIKTGLAMTLSPEKINLDETRIKTVETDIEARVSFISTCHDGLEFIYGISDTYSDYKQDYTEAETFHLHFNDHILAVFAEPEIRFSKNFGLRPGLRTEYSSVLKKWNITPRVALALKTGNESQLSASYGQFYQNPESDFLKFNHNLDFQKAEHYITSFQSGTNAERLFRLEAYYKNYDKLIRFSGEDSNFPKDISSDGNGYARGIDLFFRDRKSVKALDYWMSYSFIDTERLNRNYRSKVTPDYISKHTFSLVAKYFVEKLSTQFGSSFSYASGRPYNDPNSTEFMDGKTPYYCDLSLNLAFLTNIWNNFTIVYCSLSNVLGRDNLFGYRSTYTPNSAGQYGLVPVKQDIRRFFFIGVFISIK